MVFSFEIKFNTVVKTKDLIVARTKIKTKPLEQKHILISVFAAYTMFCNLSVLTSIFKIFLILIIQLELVYLSKFMC